MDQRFRALGLSYKNTPLEIREKLSMDEKSSKKLMNLSREFNCTELLVVSTCNRTEFYFTGDDEASNAILTCLSLISKVGKKEIEGHLLYFNEEEAVSHLFRVSMGLESQVVGDLQIINQIKKSYQWSADEGMAGPYLHRLMHTIFYTNKRVVQETSFRDGAASVSYAAKELVEDLTRDIINPKVLLLGLGEIGEDVAKNLEGTKSEVYISNRTRSRAESIAKSCGYKIIEFENFKDVLADVDVIVSSVSSPEPVISKDKLIGLNILSHKFFIDLSVPRSISPDIEEINGAIIYNIDEIQSKASETLEKRIGSIPQVEAIVAEAINEFNDWSKEMIVSPTIKKIKNILEQIRQEEMARYIKSADENQVKMLDKLSRSMMQKVMKLPVLQLKAACQRGEADKFIEIFNDLFDLEKQQSPKE